MTATRRAGDRLTACPSCGRDVRITDDELVVGRSFCAACGQRFAVEEKTVGESPFRALAIIEVDGTRPPDARIAVRADGAIDVFARSATQRTALGLAGMTLTVACLAWVAWALSLGTRTDWGFLLMSGVAGLSCLSAAWAAAGSRERIRLDADTLVLTTGPFGLRKRRIPVRDIDRISVDPGPGGNVVGMTLRGGEKVGIAASYPVPAQAAAWLHSRLTEMVPVAASPHREEDRADLVLAEPRPPTARILAGTSSLTIHSARAPDWYRGFGPLGSALFSLLATVFLVPMVLEIKFPMWVVLPALAALFVVDKLPPALRHWLGHDDLEIRDGALWYRKKGLFRGAWQRTPLADIHTIRVEEDSGGRDRWRVRVHRTGQKPLFLGKGLGHYKNAVSWLAAWLRREIDAAAPSGVRALPE